MRIADTFGDICPQQTMSSAAVTMSEDCLNLNVWTGAASSREKRPVLVWIYGGRFTGGYASDPGFDSAGLDGKGLVVVTLNYRTGAFGFLASPELSAESGHQASRNYGLLDQISALRWVRRNIAAFGGDPNRVTIAGQSAGGASVMHLIYSPLAKGLFQGAISESGGARATGLGATSLDALRAVASDKLMVGQNANDTTVSGPVNGNPPELRPVLDGWVKPWTYEQALAGGHLNDVPVLAGGNKDENGASPSPTVKLADYLAAAQKEYGTLADEFLTLYPAARGRPSGRGWPRARCSRTTGGANSRGAYHGSEINDVFDNLYATNLPWTDADRAVADTLSDYVVNFATHGDPWRPQRPWPHPLARGEPPLRDHDGTRRPLRPAHAGGHGQGGLLRAILRESEALVTSMPMVTCG